MSKTADEPFEVGDVVTLKSSPSIQMSVMEVETDNEAGDEAEEPTNIVTMVTVCWFNDRTELQGRTFRLCA